MVRFPGKPWRGIEVMVWSINDEGKCYSGSREKGQVRRRLRLVCWIACRAMLVLPAPLGALKFQDAVSVEVPLLGVQPSVSRNKKRETPCRPLAVVSCLPGCGSLR